MCYVQNVLKEDIFKFNDIVYKNKMYLMYMYKLMFSKFMYKDIFN